MGAVLRNLWKRPFRVIFCYPAPLRHFGDERVNNYKPLIPNHLYGLHKELFKVVKPLSHRGLVNA